MTEFKHHVMHRVLDENKKNEIQKNHFYSCTKDKYGQFLVFLWEIPNPENSMSKGIKFLRFTGANMAIAMDIAFAYINKKYHYGAYEEREDDLLFLPLEMEKKR